ncbi:MAG: transposase [Myxococcota bacterium]
MVVCDGMSTHGAGECRKPGPTLAACWAHVVRKFRDAEADFPEAAVARDLIAKLYEIDAESKSRDERSRRRKRESSEVAGRLEQWWRAQTTLKTTSLGEAIRYTLGYWPRLKVFVNDPDVPLDNNRTERGIRGPVVGRKNHYGSRSKRGTEVAALFYSLIETSKLVGVEPRRYLQEAVTTAKAGRVLLPHELVQA